MSEFVRILKKNIINAPGWRTNRKIVVIESDDWGAIRMPSREVYNSFLKSGYAVDQRPYEKYDSLASSEDLSLLYEVLSKNRDKTGRGTVFTANAVSANPDFDKIKASSFEEYHYELFTDTLNKYSDCHNSFQLWKEGIEADIFYPQFHGREHINVASWMKALREGDEDMLFAFEHRVAGIFPKNNSNAGNQSVVALKYADDSEFEKIKVILSDGLNLFEQIHGYKSLSFIAPCNVWHPGYAETLKENGVEIIQGSSTQIIPTLNGNKKTYHYMGQKNRIGQRFLIRNCSFEPSLSAGVDTVDLCLADISLAFRWQKPAIISSHRINYIGSIFPDNRSQNLRQLSTLLGRIVRLWPDVEFMSSDQLGRLMNTNTIN